MHGGEKVYDEEGADESSFAGTLDVRENSPE